MSALLEPVSTLLDVDGMSNDALGSYVENAVLAIGQSLADLQPYIQELWVRLELGQTVLGCKTKKEYCERVLHRTPRAVQYMLAGGNPVSKRNRFAAEESELEDDYEASAASEPELEDWDEDWVSQGATGPSIDELLRNHN